MGTCVIAISVVRGPIARSSGLGADLTEGVVLDHVARKAVICERPQWFLIGTHNIRQQGAATELREL